MTRLFQLLIAFGLVEGPHQEQVSNESGAEVSVSPDGRLLAFVSGRDGRPRIFVMNVDGSGSRPITDGEGDDDTPAWSPDGRWIAFASTRARNSDIYIIAADGTAMRRITTDPGADLHPHWSQDGRRLVFTSLRNSRDAAHPQLDIFTVDADGRNERQLTSGPSTSFASWSPSGDRMAYWRMFGSNADIAVADSEGRMTRRLTSDPAFEGWPAWSPDGLRIAFARERGEEADIYVSDLRGRTGVVRLTWRRRGDAGSERG